MSHVYFLTRIGFLFVWLSLAVFAQPDPTILENGKSIERELKGGETHRYVLSLNANTLVNVVAEQRGIDVVVILIGPDGTKIQEVDSPNGTAGPETIYYVNQIPGKYLIEIRSLETDAAPGRYEARVAELRPATTADSLIAAAKAAHREADLLMSRSDGSEQAIAKFKEAIELYEKAGSTSDQAAEVGWLADAYAATGDRSRALESYRTALTLFEKIKDPEGVNTAMNRIAEWYEYQSDLESALEWYKKAISSSESYGDKLGWSNSLNNLGLLFKRIGDHEKALGAYKQSLEIATQARNKERIGNALNNIGIVYLYQGRFLEALKYFQQELALGEEYGARTDMNIGLIYDNQGDSAQAIFHYERALKKFEEWNNKGSVALALNNIGSVYKSNGDYARALQYFQKSLAINGGDAILHKNLGITFTLMGDAENGLNYLQKGLLLAEASKDPRDTSILLSDLGEYSYERGQYSAAIDYQQKAIDVVRPIASPGLLWSALQMQGWSYLAINQNANAKKAFLESISVIESLRSELVGGHDAGKSFFDDKTSAYYGLVNVFVRENELQRALEFSERAKSRTLLDIFGAGFNMVDSLTREEKEKESQLRLKIAALNTQISKSTDDSERIKELHTQLEKKRLEMEDFKVQLYAAHPELKVQRGEMTPVGWDDVGDLIGNDSTAVVEFDSYEKGFTALVLVNDPKTGRPAISIYQKEIDGKVLSKQISDFQQKLANGELDFARSAQDLFKLILGPAGEQLNGKNILIVIPDGPLWNLPFQALMDNGKYLAEKAAVSYAPSLTALREMRKRAAARKRPIGTDLIAFGNPTVGRSTAESVQQVFMGEKLEPLPEAERLVNSLAKMYGARRSKIYTGTAASEETAKREAPKYRIVQFATHGILNDVSPMYSHLVLTHDEKEETDDGLLEAWELKDLDLKAEIVILSACDTARGKVSAGEGIIGMTWAAFIAGAPTTVASQWKVESSSTTELMLEFHRQLLTGKVSKAEALRRAELKVMKMPRYRHPAYWAGFVVVGDGG